MKTNISSATAQEKKEVTYSSTTLSEENINWLERKGRGSFSGGPLTPIIVNNEMIGGLSWMKDNGKWGIGCIEFKREFQGKGNLRKVVYDNIEKDGTVSFIDASLDLQKKLANYGEVTIDEPYAFTIVKVKQTTKN